jgi:O-antigen ligase
LTWIEKTGSFTFRQLEFDYTRKMIRKHPLFGVNFVTKYRPQLYYPVDNIRHFVHNGYLWIRLKMGLLGFAPFVWLSVVFLWRGISKSRRIDSTYYRAVVLGSTVFYAGVAVANIAAPHFMQNWETAAIGFAFGINEVIYRFENAGVLRPAAMAV